MVHDSWFSLWYGIKIEYNTILNWDEKHTFRIQTLSSFWSCSDIWGWDVKTWFRSRKVRNSLIHTLNGNGLAKMKKDRGKTKDFATSSFVVGERSIVTKALSKLCGREIDWCPKQYGFRFDGEAVGMQNFIAFWWTSKKAVSFSGKGALKAKKWMLDELATDSKKGSPWKLACSALASRETASNKRNLDWSDDHLPIDFSHPSEPLEPLQNASRKLPNALVSGKWSAGNSSSPKSENISAIDKVNMSSASNLRFNSFHDSGSLDISMESIGAVEEDPDARDILMPTQISTTDIPTANSFSSPVNPVLTEALSQKVMAARNSFDGLNNLEDLGDFPCKPSRSDQEWNEKYMSPAKINDRSET